MRFRHKFARFENWSADPSEGLESGEMGSSSSSILGAAPAVPTGNSPFEGGVPLSTDDAPAPF